MADRAEASSKNLQDIISELADLIGQRKEIVAGAVACIMDNKQNVPALQPILPSAIHERERSDCIRPGFPSKALVQVRRLMRRAVRARKKSAELRAHSSHQRICTSSEGLWVPIQVVYVYIYIYRLVGFFIRGCAVWTFRSADGENAASYPFWFRFGTLSQIWD